MKITLTLMGILYAWWMIFKDIFTSDEVDTEKKGEGDDDGVNQN